MQPGQGVTPPSDTCPIDTCPLPMLIVDATGTVAQVSDGLQAMLSLGRERLLGRSFASLVRREDIDAAGGLLLRSSRSPCTLAFLGAQDVVPAITQAAPWNGGSLMTCTPADHPEEFAQEAAARRLAEQSNAEKARLLAQISHEVRTPMNIIMGYLQLARCGDIGAKEAAHLDTALSAAETLMSQMGDMLDLSKIEAGRLTLNVIPFDIRAQLNKIADQVRPRAESRGLTLDLDLDPSLPARALGDPVRILQILHNYLSNALKFTDHGRITVRARAQAVDDGWMLRLEVEDTGPGISQANQAELFQAFSRGAQAEHGSVEGWGLGLSICRAVADLMDAKLGVHSVEGEGACFHLELKLGQDAQDIFDNSDLIAAHHRFEAGLSPHIRKVLVVEDNQKNRFMMHEALSRMGHDVTVACDGIEAVEACAARSFDVILMDIRMPRMRGDEAAQEIRHSGKNRETPIIAVTANSIGTPAGGFHTECIDAVMTKPLDLSAVRALLDGLGSD